MLTNSYAFALGVVLAVGLMWHEWRAPRRRPWVIVFRIALAAWAAIIVGWTLFPLPVFEHSIAVMREGSEGPPYVNLVPLATVSTAISGDAGPQQVRYVVGNLFAFAPFGILAPLLVPGMRHWWSILGAALAISLAIESAQWAGSMIYGFPWKSFDVDDIILNTLGALLGYGLYRSVLHRGLEGRVDP